MIQTWMSDKRQNIELLGKWAPTTREHSAWEVFIPSADPIVITAMMALRNISRIYMNGGS
ncbi:hypothetical protein Tco_0801693, partial [Tanacetum coccineum]